MHLEGCQQWLCSYVVAFACEVNAFQLASCSSRCRAKCSIQWALGQTSIAKTIMVHHLGEEAVYSCAKHISRYAPMGDSLNHFQHFNQIKTYSALIWASMLIRIRTGNEHAPHKVRQDRVTDTVQLNTNQTTIELTMTPQPALVCISCSQEQVPCCTASGEQTQHTCVCYQDPLNFA